MKKRLLLVLCAFVLLGVSAAFRRPKAPQQATAKTTSESALPTNVNQVIANWRAGAVLPLASDSSDLQKGVGRFRDAGLETVSTSFPPTKAVELTTDQSSDLAFAITGFLISYSSNDPSKVFAYMQERGKRLDNDSRKFMTLGVSKASKRDLSNLSDKEFFIEAWNQFEMHSHWHGLVAEESALQVWDGRGMSVEEIQQIETDPLSNPLSMAAVLSHLFRGYATSRHNFIPNEGSLKEELATSKPVVLADTTLVVQLDQSLANERVAYITRFWFNRAAGKWQPISFVGIPWSPTVNALPSILY